MSSDANITENRIFLRYIVSPHLLLFMVKFQYPGTAKLNLATREAEREGFTTELLLLFVLIFVKYVILMRLKNNCVNVLQIM